MMNDSIYKYINNFVNYSIDNNLINEYDAMYVINNLLRILKISDYLDVFKRENNVLLIDEILEGILEYAISNHLIENYNYQKDLLDTEIMDIVTPFPSTIIKEFYSLYEKNPNKATDYFYKLMISCNYIRMNRINKNVIFNGKSSYGDIIITINLSKPEKDPKEIAKLKELNITNKYPKCLLCYENVGFAGNEQLQARNNLRVIPLKLNDEQFYFQYSPYVYYNEHCIVFKEEHQEMKIDQNTFERLIDFVDQFPHYFIGSNADLPIVGGSILVHEHYQGGNFIFPIDNATIRYQTKINDVIVNYLNWPLDCLQLISENKENLIALANKVLITWKKYNNPNIKIFNQTDNVEHNTITPIVRKINNKYILTLVLRNNYTTLEKPYGLYHPDIDLHHVKKENIGLIEVMGLAILPQRLKEELKILEDILYNKRSEADLSLIKHHQEWYYQLRELEKDKLDLNQELTDKFVAVLESCQVFKYGKFEDVIDFINLLK